LLEGVSAQEFLPWELEDNVFCRMKLELDEASQVHRAKEMLHSAAYRSSGLGNSLYSPEHMVCLKDVKLCSQLLLRATLFFKCVLFQIGKHHTMQMRDYFSQTFTSNRSALVGVGISHDQERDSPMSKNYSLLRFLTQFLTG
jgi:hypothetical protein